MSINAKKFSRGLTILAVLGLAVSPAAAPLRTLTVTPAIVGNDYTGFITLNITGLGTGEKVVIQKYLDENTNGVVEPGDLLMDAFKIADGGAMMINGIVNPNVPYDRNITNGSITTKLNFAPPMVLENIVGQHLYQLSSTNGSFAPVTATLLVTNAATGQTLSGIVYSNGIAPLAHAVVVVLPPDGNGYTGATMTDANGHYQINVNPGTCLLMAACPNYFIDQSLAPLVTVTNGLSATNDFSLTRGTVTLAGSLYDSGNSNGIGGLMFQVESGNLFGVGFTDTNGNFSAAVSPGYWKLQPNKERAPRRAFVPPQNSWQVDASTGSVANVNLALNKGNAMFYGRITGPAGLPLANIEFNAGDTNNQYSSKGFSDTNGDYAVVVLGDTNQLGTTNLCWSDANTSANQSLAGAILNVYDSTNVLANHAIQENYVVLPVSAQVSGQVRDGSGNPVVGVELSGYTFDLGGYNYQSLTARTDNSGNYRFGVAAGTWQVQFIYGSNHDLANQGLVDLLGPYSVSIPPTNAILNLTVYPNGTPLIRAASRNAPAQFNFSVAGAVGASYTLQVSTNLATTNWASLYTFQLTSNNFPIIDNQATNSPRYYRLLKN